MRRTIEKLAWLLNGEVEHQKETGGEVTLGALAEKYGESIERIMDAMDVIKIVHGDELRMIPPVDWNRLPERQS